MTTKQRNFVLAALGVAGVFYIAPVFFGPRPLIRFGSPIRPQQPAPKKDSAPRPVPPGANATQASDPSFDRVTGVWEGGGPAPPNMCTLKLEIRPKEGDPAKLAGFPVLTCFPITMPRVRDAKAQQNLLARFSPMSSVLTGTAEKGSVQFTVDKVIGKTSDGCSIQGMTVTPFGVDQLSAEWRDSACQGGQVLLKKSRG